jgi:hypothetical protein
MTIKAGCRSFRKQVASHDAGSIPSLRVSSNVACVHKFRNSLNAQLVSMHYVQSQTSLVVLECNGASGINNTNLLPEVRTYVWSVEIIEIQSRHQHCPIRIQNTSGSEIESRKSEVGSRKLDVHPEQNESYAKMASPTALSQLDRYTVDSQRLGICSISVFYVLSLEHTAPPIPHTSCLTYLYNMPVFQETSNAARDLRISPSRAPPLPRLSPKSDYTSSAEEKREVVVIGVGVHQN